MQNLQFAFFKIVFYHLIIFATQIIELLILKQYSLYNKEIHCLIYIITKSVILILNFNNIK